MTDEQPQLSFDDFSDVDGPEEGGFADLAIAPLSSSPVDRTLLYTDDGLLRRDLPAADGTGGAVFSTRQAAAIERRGETLVSAGAGAGKTSVLVERYLRLLEGDDTLSTSSILAITFTDKAAAEMRDRVRLRLSALIGGQTDLPERWRLEDSWIGTFHGIAQRLLRRFSLAAGLDPDVVIADEDRSSELRSEAFERALVRWLGDPVAARGAPFPPRDETDGPVLPVDAHAALALAASAGIDALRAATLELLALRRTQGRDPAALPTPETTALPIPAAVDRAALRTAAQRVHAAAAPAAEEAREVLAAGKATDAGQRGLDLIHDAVAEIGLSDPETLPSVAVLERWTLPNRTPKVGKGPLVGELREAIGEAIAVARARDLGPHGVRDLRLREALLVATARTYRQLKQEQATLDFDDLLLALLDLLRRNPEIASRLRARFRQVLVDEYQDTNPVQLELVERLTDPEGRFQVGDRLQAIYGFRHATVAGFDTAAQRAESVGGRLALNETFRCRVDILAVANRIGRPSHDGFQPLVGGHDRPLQDARDAPPVEVHVLLDGGAEADAAGRSTEDQDGDRGPSVYGPEGPELSDAPVAPGEANYVAALVEELLTAGRRAADIALLVRRKAPVAALERALLERGIDTVPVVAAPLLETLEVRELEAWLRAVANPHDDVALLGALRLPTTGLDADALVPLVAEHRAAWEGRPRNAKPSVWDTLEAFLEPGFEERFPISESARDDLDSQLTVLRKHRAAARHRGPAALLAEIRGDDGYRASILSRPGGVRRWAGVDAFIDWVEEQEAAGDDLVSLLDRIAGRRHGPDAPVLTDGDAVRITTVHRSKGLEWPVVICCDLGAPVRVVEPGILVDGDPSSTRIGLRLPHPFGDAVQLWDYATLAAEAKRAQAEEERRLMHVAMTRAKERLILCGSWAPETEGKGEDRRPTGRLKAEQAQLVEPGNGHDLKPRTAPMRWVLPLVAPPDVWPSCGNQTDLDVHDGSGATDRPGRVRIVVADPARTPAPDLARQPGDAPLVLAAPPDEDDPDETVAGSPTATLPDPVSFSALNERLGRAGDAGDYWRDATQRAGSEEDEDTDESPSGPAVDALTPPLFTTGVLDGRVRGAVVHRLLERRMLDPDGPSPTPEDVRILLADEDEALPPVDDADARALIDLCGRLEASDAAQEALRLPAERRHVERPFLFDPGEGLPLIQGVIDLWLEDGDRATIVDWKTNDLAGRTPLQTVTGHYGLQRDVYALAALLGGVQLVHVAFVFSDAPDHPVTFAFTAADRDALLQHVRDAMTTATLRD